MGVTLYPSSPLPLCKFLGILSSRCIAPYAHVSEDLNSPRVALLRMVHCMHLQCMAPDVSYANYMHI